ncbi:MAG: hypothetical protein ACRBN8_13435 [Nannocystales bacterium]
MSKWFPWLGCLFVSACVLPADEPTGLEFSWRFVEVNTIDGEDGQRLRSCAGGRVDEVVFSITDTTDASRSEIFRYDCGTGYQTISEFATESSDAFVELRPKKYEVLVDIVSETPAGAENTRRARTMEIDVLERTITLQDFDFGLEPVEMQLSLEQTDTCDEVSLSLRYAELDADLAEPPLNEDGTAVTSLLYREALESEQGLSLSGTPAACAELPSAHTILEVDPGHYLLDVAVDATVCTLDLEVGQGAEAHVIDLANLPCEG